MKGFKEVGIPLLIWAYFITEGLKGAMLIPSLNIEPKDQLPTGFKLIAISLTFIAGFAVVYINSKRSKMAFEYWLEKKLSEDSFNKISRRINFPILAASFFGLIGIGGLAKAAAIGSPQINRDFLQITASMGVGCFVGMLVTRFATAEPKY